MIVTSTQHRKSHIMEQSADDSHLYTAQEVTYHGTVSTTVTCTQHRKSHIMEQSAHDSHLYTAQEVTYHGTVSR